MTYATLNDLAAYLGTTVDALGANSQRLLTRASELVDQVTRGRVDPAKASQLDAAKNATVAQVEYWNTVGEEVSIVGPTGPVAIGSFKMDGQLPELAPRTRAYLQAAGLLHAGVTTRRSGNAALVQSFFGPRGS